MTMLTETENAKSCRFVLLCHCLDHECRKFRAACRPRKPKDYLDLLQSVVHCRRIYISKTADQQKQLKFRMHSTHLGFSALQLLYSVTLSLRMCTSPLGPLFPAGLPTFLAPFRVKITHV